jgi:ankyrin repeat protein
MIIHLHQYTQFNQIFLKKTSIFIMETLSLEVIYLIFKQLKIKDIRSLSTTCKALNVISDEYYIEYIIEQYKLPKSLLVIVENYPWLATPTVFKKIIEKGASVSQRYTTFGVPLLHFVVKRGLLSLLPLFKACVNVINAITRDTALHLAVQLGDKTMVRRLIEMQARCISNSLSCTPVHLAVINNRLDILEILVNDHIDFEIIQWYTVLTLAVSKAHRPILAFLLYKLNLRPNLRDRVFGETLLATLYMKDFNTACFLIRRTCQTGSKLYKDISNHTPYHISAKYGQLAVLKCLKKYHIEGINQANNVGYTPLHLAVINGHLEVVKYLIKDINVDPNIPNTHGYTPLATAIQFQKLKIACILASIPNININAKILTTNKTILHLAVLHEQLDVVKIILTIVKDIHEDNERSNPLHIAAMGTSLEILKLLVEQFPELINKKNFAGYTPLHFAVERGNLEMIKYLLSKNASKMIKNKDGLTPWQLAKKQTLLQYCEFIKMNIEKDR